MSLLRHLGQIFVLHLSMLLCSPSLFAQRYLTEFVGTSTFRSSTNAVQLSTNLAFDSLDNRRLDGLVSLGNSINSKTDLFAVQGTLANSGNCNVQLRNATTSGGLNLVEIPFDDNSFALIGNSNANINGGSLLAVGKYRGTTAVMRPVADPVLVADSIMVIAVSSLISGQQSLHRLTFTEMLDSLSFSGRLAEAGLLSGFNLTVSANSRWTYIVGENGNLFLAMRVASILDDRGLLDGFSGQFQLYDAGGKLQDFGPIVGGPPAGR